VHQIPGKYFQSLDRVLTRPGGALILTLSVPTLKEVRPAVGLGAASPGGCHVNAKALPRTSTTCSSQYLCPYISAVPSIIRLQLTCQHMAALRLESEAPYSPHSPPAQQRATGERCSGQCEGFRRNPLQQAAQYAVLMGAAAAEDVARALQQGFVAEWCAQR
jgi:hypothetical protein